MTFELLPVTDLMLRLYQQPIGTGRFQAYLKALQGDSRGNLVLPIGGFNPMAKAQAIEKLKELKHLDAEAIIQDIAAELSQRYKQQAPAACFKIALNLSDDLKGGWTNRYTSDYDSKFKINALVSRHFCTPIFWTSEAFTQALIRERVLAYAHRSIYWQTQPKPTTLKAHVAQECFVAKQLPSESLPAAEVATLDTFYNTHQNSEDYHTIFNFFYGDAAAQSLNFPAVGLNSSITGFDYARYLSHKNPV